jgi:alpha-L-rhamnosidase
LTKIDNMRVNSKLQKIIFFVVLSLLGVCPVCSQHIEINGLQCEYQENPLGLDTPTPRFSWQLFVADPIRGLRQGTYHILVASDQTLLNEEQADVWNSGQIASSQSVLVSFAGKELESSRKYYWKVRVSDKEGVLSTWSQPASFTTGLLHPGDWSDAWWIQYPDAPRGKHIWFRKTLSIDAPVRSALIHVASIGYHELYVNGKKADDRVLAPALTRLSTRALYVTYDIADLLQQGENVIALWHAPGWTLNTFVNLPSAIRVQLKVWTTDDKKINLSSYDDWLCAISNSENNVPRTRPENHGGERIDARDYLPNWNKPGFDDKGWAKAVRVDYQPLMCAHSIEPTRIIDTIQPIGISGGDDAYRIDMGKNFTGWVKMDFSGLSSGDVVTIKVSDDEKTIQDCGQMSQYISNGAEKETFCNHFNYIGGRYVTVEGLKRKPELTEITGYALGTDLKRTGHFFSSKPFFNQIYETDLWTFRANTTEGYTSDCPHRERMGYGEVATATSWGIAFPNYRAGAFYNKVVRDWTDAQEGNGWFYHTAPLGNKDFGGPMWSSAGLNVSWEHYLQYGDRQILDLIYPSARRWLDFLHSNTENGLLAPYNGRKEFFLGDWLAPGGLLDWGDSPNAKFFNNCVYVMNLQTFIRIAGILNHQDEAVVYSKRLDALKSRIHETFFHPESNTYMDGRQVYMAFALLTGIVPDHLRQAVADSFNTDLSELHPYLDMGSSGISVLLKYLTSHPENGAVVARHLSSVTEPSYGYFIARGENTWPEYWNSDVESRIHTCYTGIASWFIKSLCGIRPDPAHPGYQQFIIQPVIVSEVTFAEASVESPYGQIRSRWERRKNKVELSVTVPPNSTATVYIPAKDMKSITENGVKVDKIKGVTPKGMEGEYAVVIVEGGKYRFEVK